jgi:hypothetical protein
VVAPCWSDGSCVSCRDAHQCLELLKLLGELRQPVT